MQGSGEKKTVVLINPNWRQLDEPFEHLGLGYLAACLRNAGIDTLIIDMPLSGSCAAEVIATIKQNNCALIGVSITFQESAQEVLAFVTELKQHTAVPIAVGGIYPTFASQEIMSLYPSVDFIIKGEGEETVVELAQAILANGDVHKVAGLVGRTDNEFWETPDRPSVQNLDTLPLPARDTLPDVLAQTGYASLLSSRGCYGRCTFCSVDAFFSRFGAKFRLRSADSVIEELEMLQQKFGVVNFAFNDANFICGKGRGSERAREIAELILQKGWQIRFSIQCRVNDVEPELFALLKKAGLCKVFLGVESGSQAVLDRFQKDVTVADNLRAIKILSDLDIFIAMGFIMFDYRTSINDLNNNLQFLRQVREMTGKAYLAEVDPVSKVLPFAGTKVEAELKQEKRYLGNSLSFSYKLADPLVEFIYQGLSKLADIKRKKAAKRGESLYREFDWHTGGIKNNSNL
ncbi:MAG: B12-binding domain-containing radical SAM protein [Firmicutes bacterium]|mgnify:CR=1 FL=1|nr:B12-binding domain-containing radical SAM protein [Bacillota bacterium]